MKKRLWIMVAAIGFAPWVGVQAVGPSDTPFGVSFSPPNYPEITLDDYRQGLLEAAALGGHVSYIFAWEDGDEEFNVVSTIMRSVKSLGKTTLLQFGPTSIGYPAPPRLGFSPISFNNPDIRKQYLLDVKRLAAIRPTYLNLCAELNLMFFSNWREYEYFKTLYRMAYTLVKQISPATQVGISHNLDVFFGDEEYALLYDLGPQDYIGFTSYPAHLVYDGYVASVEEFPAAYYSRIRLLIPDKPVLFTEIGWPSQGNGSYDNQATFVKRLPELMRDVKPALISWALQHDVNVFQTWKLSAAQRALLAQYKVDPELLFVELNSMGLLFQHGPAKPAWFEAVKLNFDAVR